MLTAILEAVTIITPQVSPQVKRLLKVLNDGELGATEIMKRLKLKDRKSFRKNYLVPALKANVVEMTIPDKPNSRLQKYRRKVVSGWHCQKFYENNES